MSQTLTLTEISRHKTWLVIHNKVYDVAKFMDEHPGGDDVLLDRSGQDASEEFEDVGHSDEAREVLTTLQIGTVKRLPGDPEPIIATMRTKPAEPTVSASSGVPSIAVYVGGLVCSVIAIGLCLKFTA